MTQTVNTAYDLFDAGRYDEAYASLSKLAEAGDGSANLHLGWINQKGLGRQVDLTKAEQHYLSAYKHGVPEAQYYLGCLYRSMGRYQEALRHLEEAASQGHPSAAYWVHVIYNDGEGVTKDSGRAVQYLQKASDLGHIFAKRDLAKRAIRGEFGLAKIPSGFCALISNAINGASIASANPDDVRVR